MKASEGPALIRVARVASWTRVARYLPSLRLGKSHNTVTWCGVARCCQLAGDRREVCQLIRSVLHDCRTLAEHRLVAAPE